VHPTNLHNKKHVEVTLDHPDVGELVEKYGYRAHIHSRGEEIKEKKETQGYRARRWVVERTHSWMNRFRRLLIGWEKWKNAMLHFACSCFRAAGLFGWALNISPGGLLATDRIGAGDKREVEGW